MVRPVSRTAWPRLTRRRHLGSRLTAREASAQLQPPLRASTLLNAQDFLWRIPDFFAYAQRSGGPLSVRARTKRGRKSHLVQPPPQFRVLCLRPRVVQPLSVKLLTSCSPSVPHCATAKTPYQSHDLSTGRARIVDLWQDFVAPTSFSAVGEVLTDFASDACSQSFPPTSESRRSPLFRLRRSHHPPKRHPPPYRSWQTERESPLG